jgi:CubicO group peptidase (beta-lactamase class C family)
LFPIGSFTKGFIATAIGILIDDMAKGSKGSDRLTWASKLQDILPDDWAMSDRELGVHATLADILSLSSGVPQYVNYRTSPLLISSGLANKPRLDVLCERFVFRRDSPPARIATESWSARKLAVQ